MLFQNYRKSKWKLEVLKLGFDSVIFKNIRAHKWSIQLLRQIITYHVVPLEVSPTWISAILLEYYLPDSITSQRVS